MNAPRFRRSLLAVALAATSMTAPSTVMASPATAASKTPTSSFTVPGWGVGMRSGIVDYVMYRCAGKRVTFKFRGISAADRVNGKPVTVRHGAGSWSKTMTADEIVTIRFADRRTTFYVRCLPDDFPRLKFSVADAKQAPSGFYLMPYYSRSVPGQAFGANYYIVTDQHGTPVWYRRASGGSTVLTADGSGNLITQGVLNGLSPGVARPENAVNVISPDGTVVRTIKPVDPLIRPAERLANGNLLLISAPTRQDVDFTKLATKFKDNSAGVCALNRAAVDVQGLRITEVTAQGAVVWDADLTDQIGFEEPSQASVVNVALPGQPAECMLDLFHANHVSASADGASYVVSLRWTGVFGIDKQGQVTWKLGGSTTLKSLTVVDDPLGTAGPIAQHGGYLTADGRLLVFDNQLARHVLARGVEYVLDPVAKTATYRRSFTHDASFCVVDDGQVTCPASSQGNASYLADGNVLVSWGNTEGRAVVGTVFDASGAIVATMSVLSDRPNVFTVYHAPAGSFTISRLRAGATSAATVRNGTYN